MNITYSTNPRDAKIEGEMRQWFRDNFGEEDSKTLVEWLWEHNGKNGVRFVDALVHIARETQVNGKAFVQNLLDVAKKPKHIREAELEILAWAKPRIEAAVAKIRGHRAATDVQIAETDAFMHALEDKLWNMWPHKHRATMKGAILSAFNSTNGKFELRVSDLVKALNLEDPLAATAPTSGRR